MPFNGNVGMHDASWRSEFGGWIYIIDGSHGCINLPTQKAAEIYEVVEKGEPIFVYGGKTQPEAVITQEVVDPVTGEIKVIKMPASVAAAEGIAVDTPADSAPVEGTPIEATPEETSPVENPATAETPAPAEAVPAE